MLEKKMIACKQLSSANLIPINLQSISNCSQLKTELSKRLRTDKSNIDIVSITTGVLYDDDDAIPNTRLVDVMVHPATRHVPFIWCSPNADMIDGTVDEPRVSMSCSHAITPDNLYQMSSVYIKGGKHQLYCVTCNKTWEFNEISEKSAMSADEKIFWGTKISLNSLRQNKSLDVTECPNCGSFCERSQKTDKWVICYVCSKRSQEDATFCWDCKDTTWSDNHVCKNLQQLQDLLLSCPRKTIDYAKIGNVPSIRVCPRCGHMIEHRSECKSMECLKCHCEFCFVCLKICVNGDLSCNNYKSMCEVAPIQKII